MREWTAAACAASGPARLYDRWPWIHLAIAGVLGAVALVTLPWVREHPRWLWFLFLAVPALVLHQFEEYVLPGGYAPWFNAHVYRSRNPHFPCTSGRSPSITSRSWSCFRCWRSRDHAGRSSAWAGCTG